MLKEELLSKNFYLDNMSMFLKDSFGMIDREETYRAVLNNINDFADNLISRYDIFNILFTGDYFERNGINRNDDEDAVLDNIASIFGINRYMHIEYIGVDYNGHYGESGVLQEEDIVLTNYELYVYIRIIITKLNYQGTAGEIVNLYYGDDDTTDPVKQLKIKYSWDDSHPLTCDLWFCNPDIIRENNYQSNLVKLFLADKIVIESLGIQYNKHLSPAVFVGQFDVVPASQYMYFFDPDFDNDTEDGFRYAVFA